MDHAVIAEVMLAAKGSLDFFRVREPRSGTIEKTIVYLGDFDKPVEEFHLKDRSSTCKIRGLTSRG